MKNAPAGTTGEAMSEDAIEFASIVRELSPADRAKVRALMQRLRAEECAR